MLFPRLQVFQKIILQPIKTLIIHHPKMFLVLMCARYVVSCVADVLNLKQRNITDNETLKKDRIRSYVRIITRPTFSSYIFTLNHFCIFSMNVKVASRFRKPVRFFAEQNFKAAITSAEKICTAFFQNLSGKLIFARDNEPV